MPCVAFHSHWIFFGVRFVELASRSGHGEVCFRTNADFASTQLFLKRPTCLFLQKTTFHGKIRSIAVPVSLRTNLSPFTKGCRGRGTPMRIEIFVRAICRHQLISNRPTFHTFAFIPIPRQDWNILAEGAIVRPMTSTGGVLIASWKLLQFPSSSVCGSSCNFSVAVARSNIPTVPRYTQRIRRLPEVAWSINLPGWR